MNSILLEDLILLTIEFLPNLLLTTQTTTAVVAIGWWVGQSPTNPPTNEPRNEPRSSAGLVGRANPPTATEV
jgi:hypothetical protein